MLPFCWPPVAGGGLLFAGVLSLPGTRGSVFLGTGDFDFPLLWVVMGPAGLSHVLDGEQRGLAENLLVSWRKCEERAGEDESILMGAHSYLGAAEANRRQRGEEWEILSEPHWAGHHFPRAGSDPASPHLRFHRSLPWSPCSHAGHRRVLAPPFPASQEGRATAGALGHCTDLRVNDFFHL